MNLSKHVSLWAVLLVIFNGLFLSAIVPPMQSPDEPQHVQRAYLLTQGKILLEAPEGVDAGGMFDTGLRDFMKHYMDVLNDHEHKQTAEQILDANRLKWTGEKVYLSTAGAGFYFPLIYFPQAAGLWVGETFDLSIATSYQLARYASILCIAIALLAAFTLYPVNPWVLACLVLPMTAFQCASASLDGFSTALSILAIAIFLRLMEQKSLRSYLFYIALGAITLVATSRIHLIPLLGLPFVLSYYSKSLLQFLASVVATGFVCVWVWLAMTYNTHHHIEAIVESAPNDILRHYITHPWDFLHIFFNTITDPSKFISYGVSFLGVLGWLDLIFPLPVYCILAILFIGVAGFSISFRTESPVTMSRWVLLLVAVTSIFLMFFIFSIVWTEYPATVIEGVQGRYFIVPFILLAYACSGIPQQERGLKRWAVAFWLVILLEVVSLSASAPMLIERYYASVEDIFLNF